HSGAGATQPKRKADATTTRMTKSQPKPSTSFRTRIRHHTSFRALAALFSAFLLLASLVAPPSFAAATPTLAQILARAYTARGGLVRLHALQGQRITGTISFGNDASGPFFVEFKRPLKMHMELTVQNQTMVRIYDGTQGWASNPFAGKSNLDP